MLSTGNAVRVNAHGLVNRRSFLAACGVAGFSSIAAAAPELRKQGKSCILLWMAGGPSQFETMDPKPGAETQGTTRAIASSAPGISIAEHWTRTAAVMKEFAVLRSMTSKEGNHGRATYLLHTSYAPSGGIVHPGIGSVVASEIGNPESDMPNFVAISGQSVGPSFLGVRNAPFIVTDPNRPPDNLAIPVAPPRLDRRLELLKELEAPQLRTATAPLVKDHQTLYDQTSQMVRSPRTRAFDLDAEPEKLRDAYGRSAFGQGCLMARRLIEADVPFVEVQSSGWDTHTNELPGLKKLIPPVDQGMATLVADLKDRGLLERTLVIWMGEFGRMPQVNLAAGRDHYPQAFNVMMAGLNVKGGQVIGATDKLGIEVVERPTSVMDLFCTYYKALGINPRKENQTNVNRPLKIVEEGEPVNEVFS
jgi:hypothetical protein